MSVVHRFTRRNFFSSFSRIRLNVETGVDNARSFAFATYTANGLRSVPYPNAPRCAHSTNVVPLPQKGSKTLCDERTSKMLRIARATWGLNFPLYSCKPWTE